jgi:hypothetical protein
MNRPDLPSDNTTSLAALMRTDGDNAPPWDCREWGDILAHQLATPLEADLENIEGWKSARAAVAHGNDTAPIRTFRDLLFHPKPSVEMLELVKRFAKQCRGRPDSLLPDEIATLLYLLAIVAARAHRGMRISGLDDQALRAGLQWALSQTWLDDATRTLLEQGLGLLQD